MEANRNDTWKSLVAMVAKETEAERLNKLAAELERILSKKKASTA
jgi:hypothetical protein